MTAAPEQPYRTTGRNSELNGVILDDVYSRAASSGQTVIIISRLGVGERGMSLHQRRLHNAVERITYSGKRPLVRPAVACAGVRTSGKAQLEVYIGGSLYWVVELDRGQDVAVDCCGVLSAYYPWYRGKPTIVF